MGVFMNFRKLITYLTMGTAAAMPLAVAQNPTILQGSYISNVFGNSNFIKNPNAQTNIADVTVSNATVTRSTTTPLVATTEFNITTSTATGYADWATRTFDAGMKNQNCEARFTYRGFSVGSTTVQIRQGSNTVAQLTLTASTDPRIASINFPCGDLSAATTLRVQQATASLTGTNELSGLYLGLATNQANVAQAEAVVRATRTTAQSIPNTGAVLVYNTLNFDNLGEYNTTTGRFQAKRAGRYFITAMVLWDSVSIPTGETRFLSVRKNGSSSGEATGWENQQVTSTRYVSSAVNTIVELAVGEYIEIFAYQNSSGAKNTFADAQYTNLSISRFPTSSELVVTPERQNTFAGIKGVASGGSNVVTSASWTKLTSASTMTRTVFGKAKVESNNDYSITIENLPVGSYYITASGLFYAQAAVSGATTECFYGIADTATGGAQIGGLQANSTGDATLTNQTIINSTMGGIYTNTSVASRTFFIQALRAGGTGSCNAFNTSDRPLTISVIPLDQPSNSALYVEGPVKASATGAAIPAGYVGQTKVVNTLLNTNWTVSGAYVNVASITLEAGIWSCSAAGTYIRNGANFTILDNALFTFSEGTGAPAFTFNAQSGNMSNALSTTFSSFGLTIPTMTFRSTGTQLVWPDGVTRGTNILYVNGYLSSYTSGTPQYVLRVECVRIN